MGVPQTTTVWILCSGDELDEHAKLYSDISSSWPLAILFFVLDLRYCSFFAEETSFIDERLPSRFLRTDLVRPV